MRIGELESEEIALGIEPAAEAPWWKRIALWPSEAIVGPLFGRIAALQALRPSTFDLGREEHPLVRLMWTNGIRNSLDDARNSAQLISELAGYYNVHGVYNYSIDTVGDVFRCIFEGHGHPSQISEMIRKEWIRYLQSRPPGCKIVHVCHSEGVLQVYDALLWTPSEYRSCIHIIAVGPPIFIPKGLCASVMHLVSQRDLIPFLAVKKALETDQFDSFKFLIAHSEAIGWDHYFDSLTYRDALETELRRLIVS